MFIFKLVQRQVYRSRFLSLIAVVGVLVLVQRPSFAVDYFWAAPVSGDATVATNWTPNGVPNSTADTTNFNLGSSGYTVTAPLNNITTISLGALNIGTDNVTFNFNEGTINYNSISLGQKSGDVANLTLLNASVESTNGLNAAVGDAAGSTAKVTVGSSQFPGFLGVTSIGNSGNGTVDVFQGRVGVEYLGFAANSQGTVVVDGVKSSWFNAGNTPLYVGDAGNGSLTVQNGAAGSAQGLQTYIANQQGTQGTVTITGAGSTWTNRDALYIGYGGTGAMNVTAGAVATAQNSTDIGYLSASTGTLAIDGVGSKVTTSDPLTVGTQGTGSIAITAGGVLSANGTTIGDQQGSQGSITVDGAGSSFTNGNLPLYVGNNGTGSLALTGGGSATVGAYVGYGTGGSGSVSADGTGTSLSGSVFLRGVGAGGASLAVTNGASFSGNLQFVSGNTGPLSATFDGTGTTATATMTLFSGGGTLKIQNGAVVNTPSSGALETGLVATTVSGAGTQWNIQATDVNQGTGILVGNFASGSGLLRVSGGATVNVGVLAGSPLGVVDVLPGALLDVLQGTVNGSVGNSGTVNDNGLINGNFTMSQASLLTGTGKITGSLKLDGTVAPGNSPGTLTVGGTTWDSTGTFKLAVNDANGTAGGTSGWGLLSVLGNADLKSVPHTISLESLTAGNAPGAIANFDPTHNYSWTFFSTTGVIVDAAGFNIDTSGFDNPIYGHFSVTANESSLVLNYTAPEPSTFVLAGLGVTIGCVTRLRGHRNRKES